MFHSPSQQQVATASPPSSVQHYSLASNGVRHNSGYGSNAASISDLSGMATLDSQTAVCNHGASSLINQYSDNSSNQFAHQHQHQHQLNSPSSYFFGPTYISPSSNYHQLPEHHHHNHSHSHSHSHSHNHNNQLQHQHANNNGNIQSKTFHSPSQQQQAAAASPPTSVQHYSLTSDSASNNSGYGNNNAASISELSGMVPLDSQPTVCNHEAGNLIHHYSDNSSNQFAHQQQLNPPSSYFLGSTYNSSSSNYHQPLEQLHDQDQDHDNDHDRDHEHQPRTQNQPQTQQQQQQQPQHPSNSDNIRTHHYANAHFPKNKKRQKQLSQQQQQQQHAQQIQPKSSRKVSDASANLIDESATYVDEDIEHTSTHITVTNLQTGAQVTLTNEDLISWAVKDLNKKVTGFPKDTITKLKQRRRTLKNRGYAQNCRHKRLNQKNELEKRNRQLQIEVDKITTELEEIRSENVKLLAMSSQYSRELDAYRRYFEEQHHQHHKHLVTYSAGSQCASQ